MVRELGIKIFLTAILVMFVSAVGLAAGLLAESWKIIVVFAPIFLATFPAMVFGLLVAIWMPSKVAA